MKKYLIRTKEQGDLMYTLRDNPEEAWSALKWTMQQRMALISPFDELSVVESQGHDVGEHCGCDRCEAYRVRVNATCGG